jgi:hypothetical protein
VRQYFNCLVRDNGGADVTLKPAKACKKAQMTCRMVRGPGRRKKSAQRIAFMGLENKEALGTSRGGYTRCVR